MIITNKPIIVIQNTSYHFEITLSIYQSHFSMGLNVYLCCCAPNRFDQSNFLKEINVRLADEEIVKEACCGFVVSAYPNPQISISDPIPNSRYQIFKELNDKLIYISHRFKNESDYVQNVNPITKKNSICLSPIAEKIGLDYFNPIEMPIKEQNVKINNVFKLTAQHHFNLNGRDIGVISEILSNVKKDSFKVNLLGTKANNILDKFEKNISSKISAHEGLSEKKFYDIINLNTNFLLCLIDNKTSNQTYIDERYSTNFNQSASFNKPVFCHEYFEEIYEIPGIYYNNKNIIEKFEELLSLSEVEYSSLVAKFDSFKKKKKEHNNKVLNEKISRYL